MHKPIWITVAVILAYGFCVNAKGMSETFSYSLTSGDPQMVVNIPDAVNVSVRANSPGVRCVVRVFGPEDPQAGSGVRRIVAEDYNGSLRFQSFRIVGGARDYQIVVTPVVTENDAVYRQIRDGGSTPVSVNINW